MHPLKEKTDVQPRTWNNQDGQQESAIIYRHLFSDRGLSWFSQPAVLGHAREKNERALCRIKFKGLPDMHDSGCTSHTRDICFRYTERLASRRPNSADINVRPVRRYRHRMRRRSGVLQISKQYLYHSTVCAGVEISEVPEVSLFRGVR